MPPVAVSPSAQVIRKMKKGLRYFIFPVHIFKTIRNNWINQKDSSQTFIFSQFIVTSSTDSGNSGMKLYAKVSDLKHLQAQEEGKIIKLALALSQKVLHPVRIETKRKFMCKIF